MKKCANNAETPFSAENLISNFIFTPGNKQLLTMNPSKESMGSDSVTELLNSNPTLLQAFKYLQTQIPIEANLSSLKKFAECEVKKNLENKNPGTIDFSKPLDEAQWTQYADNLKGSINYPPQIDTPSKNDPANSAPVYSDEEIAQLFTSVLSDLNMPTDVPKGQIKSQKP